MRTLRIQCGSGAFFLAGKCGWQGNAGGEREGQGNGWQGNAGGERERQGVRGGIDIGDEGC